MRSIIALTLVLFVGLTACAAPISNTAPLATTAPPTASTSELNAQGKIRFSYPASPGVADIPFFMALDRLRELGYAVETQQFARFELNLAALMNGELDIASGSLQPAWTAISKEAPMRTIVSRLRNADLITAKKEITSCSDLGDKNVGLSSATNMNALLLNHYIARQCPGTAYTVVPIPSSTNRMAALASGTIDASNLQIEDLIQLELEKPGEFHALVDYGKEFPEIQAYAYHAHETFLAEHPQAARDFIRAFLQASREIRDKKVLREMMGKYLDLDTAMLDTAASVFVDNRMWDVNGGLTEENVESTLDFFIEAKILPDNFTPTAVVDLQFLNAVLEEIGRE